MKFGLRPASPARPQPLWTQSHGSSGMAPWTHATSNPRSFSASVFSEQCAHEQHTCIIHTSRQHFRNQGLRQCSTKGSDERFKLTDHALGTCLAECSSTRLSLCKEAVHVCSYVVATPGYKRPDQSHSPRPAVEQFPYMGLFSELCCGAMAFHSITFNATILSTTRRNRFTNPYRFHR